MPFAPALVGLQAATTAVLGHAAWVTYDPTDWFTMHPTLALVACICVVHVYVREQCHANVPSVCWSVVVLSQSRAALSCLYHYEPECAL
jgi:hypothetical protein